MGGIVGGLGKLAGGIFGGGSVKQPSFNFFPDITTPAFRLITEPGGRVELGRRSAAQRFPDVLSNLAELRGQVKPGFGRFTEAGVDAIRRSKADALGNARQQLQRRRIAGASFANAQLTGIERQFGREEALFRGQAILAELESTFKIIDEEFKVKTQNFQFEFEELKIASGVAQFVTAALSAQTLVDKQIAADAAEGAGAAFGDFGKVLGSAIGGSELAGSFTSALGSFFGGGGGDDLAAQALQKFQL